MAQTLIGILESVDKVKDEKGYAQLVELIRVMVRYSLLSQIGSLEEAFIEMGGIPRIIDLLRQGESDNLIMEGLKCLTMIIGTGESALQAMIKKQEFFQDVIDLMDFDGYSAEIRYEATKFFVWFCENVTQTSTFQLLNKTCLNGARRKNKSPFVDLVVNLQLNNSSKDLCHMTLRLINLLFIKAQTEKKRQQFLARLENMGLYDELRSLSKAANTRPQENEAILRELKSFQISTK